MLTFGFCRALDESNAYWLGNDWDWRSEKFLGDYPNLYFDTLVTEVLHGASEAEMLARAALLASVTGGRANDGDPLSGLENRRRAQRQPEDAASATTHAATAQVPPRPCRPPLGRLRSCTCPHAPLDII